MADRQNSCDVVDVVDNWEEIDENNMFDQSLSVNTSKNATVISKGPIVVQGEDSLRTQYVAPEPCVKILKRPSREERLNLSGDPSVNGLGKPVKTLRQREAEYAEARLRILGRASPDVDPNDRLAFADCSTSAVPSSAVYTLLRPSQPDSSRLPPDILRQPRGPDGSPGFTLKR